MKWLRKLLRMLELGHARQTYSDLYSDGVISLKEYLEYMKDVEKKYE